MRALILFLLAACAGAPAPVAFDGPSPERIAVLPLVAAAIEPDACRARDVVASERLEALGHRVVPAAVVASARASLPAARESAYPALGRTFDADAVLERSADVASSIDQGAPLVLVVRWRILRAASLAPLWDQSTTVRAGEIVAEHLTGPDPGDGREPYFTDAPIHGRGLGEHRSAERANTPLELIDLAERRLAARLPPSIGSMR
ncbi:MAG: hypothetical protein HZB39_15380 [Planctomycetes bacterium]|nr:hypothetical protein [Planctomycetota bacterium]